MNKSLHPLPVVKRDDDGNVYDQFSDPELRYRQRYVDLIVNPHVREVFRKRARLITTMRGYFDEKGWLEVETPVLQSIHGGRGGAALRDAPQRVGHEAVPAHRHRTAP